VGPGSASTFDVVVESAGAYLLVLTAQANSPLSFFATKSLDFVSILHAQAGTDGRFRMTIRTLRKQVRSACALLLATTLVLLSPPCSSAYSVLSHEAIIDSAWDINLKPVLLK
jgi:hypothetical protein